jgi:cytochrome P450
MQGVTLEVIMRIVFGVDEGDPKLAELRERLRRFLGSTANPREMRKLLVHGPERAERKRIYAHVLDPVDEIIAAVVADHRRRDDLADRDDVLSMLLLARHEDGSPMDDVELRDELVTLLVAGHETTATSLSWAFERLTREPAALERLVEAVDAGDDAYVTATIQEVLRHRPVLPNTAPRLVVKAIEVGGRRYEPGVCLVANAYLLHHDPEIYDEPYAFRPERFLDEAPGTYTWIPFGGGRRRCLGASFAMLEMRIVLRTVLAAYGVQAPSDRAERTARRNIAVRPADGARIAIAAREREPAAVAA